MSLTEMSRVYMNFVRELKLILACLIFTLKLVFKLGSFIK